MIKKLLKLISSNNNFENRKYWGKFEGIFSIIFNFILFIIKIIVGLLSGSIAILADAVHTLSDIISSAGIVWGFHAAYQPADKKHPYGHGRIEHIVTLTVSFLLLYTGIEFIKESIKAIKNPEIVEFNIWLFITIFATILIKEFMARVAVNIGKEINSDALIADGYHHRTDVLSTVIVIFTFFIKGIDGYLGIIVALFIIYSAFEIAKDAVDSLIGEKPSRDFIEKLKNYVLNIDVVEGIHDIIVNKYGEKVIISFHIEIDMNLSFDEAHYWSEQVEDLVDAKFGIKSVVHADPIDKNDVELNKIKPILENYFQDNKKIDSFHDLRKIGKKNVNIVFDISIREKITTSEKKKIYDDISNILEKNIDNFHDVVIKVEPLYAY